ncbi:lycopene beta-cyclase CrtY [Sphingomonas bacterium]|uniref:lycopene beta-cyclase CrtY n=1 Tax=Sphingomonas bacterium TaxID=1895847 RepID=UPI001576E1E1
MAAAQPLDLAIVGGGLAGGLLALALAARRPELRVGLIEAGDRFGGNHLWSFFDGDVDADGRALVAPLVAHRWPGYDVRFPGLSRTIDTGYHSIPSERLDAALRAALPAERLFTGTGATIEPGGVGLADGRRLPAGAVIDARGPGDLSLLRGGWQKFVGLHLTLDAPHGLTRPVVMDATVEQIDGYRFVYLLPFGPAEIFVEDTYYSDTPDLDVPAIRARIAAYATARGWRVAGEERIETGVLPVISGGDFAAYWGAGGAKAGMRAGLCQPTTGYTLPDAVRLALRITAAPDLGQAALDRLTREHAAAAWGARGFYRLLDRMLFGAAAPAERWRVLQRFYRLPAPLISRFYAGRSTLADQARVLMGRPPVPIGRALKVMWR